MASICTAQQPIKPKLMTFKELQAARKEPIPAGAISVAAENIKTVPLHIRPYIRYIWVPKGIKEDLQATILMAAHLSRSPVVPTPETTTVINGELIRLDLTDYAPLVGNDLAEFVQTWEELQYDPCFNLLITPGMLKFLPKDGVFDVSYRDWELVDRDKSFDGGKTSGRWIRKIVSKKLAVKDMKAMEFEVLRTNRADIPHEPFCYLQQQTGSLAPVVHYGYFAIRALTTIQDKELYKEIYGGLYYRFRGIRKGGRSKGTDLDALLEGLGVGNIEAGITARKLFDTPTLRSDQRSAIFRSGVTASPRRIIWFQSPAGRDTMGLVFITEDVARDGIDIDQHPIMNLVDFRFAGSEVIFVLPNGLHGYAAFDAKGNLVDEVPINIAADRTIPAPHHPRLEQAISCMRCHNERKDSLGVIPFGNDVKKMLNSGYLEPLADLSEPDKLVADTLQRIRGWYQGDPTITLMRARDDLAKTYLRVTGPWKDAGNQTEIVQLATARIARVYGEHVWNVVTPKDALRSMGYECPPERELDMLWTLLPPDRNGFDDLTYSFLEDPNIGALKAGIGINRPQWDLAQPFAAARAHYVYEMMGSLPAPTKIGVNP